MGMRLRLAKGLAEGTLEGKDLEIAKGNKIIVQEAEWLKKEKHQKAEKRKVVKHG